MPNFLNLRTKVLKMIKTSVLVLLSGLFDRSRSRTVTALVGSKMLHPSQRGHQEKADGETINTCKC